MLIVLFLSALSAPLIGVKIGGHGWDIGSRAENRRLAPLPTLLRLREANLTSVRAKFKAAAKFPGEFKYYVSDHFGFRSLLIRAHGLLMVKVLGVTSNPSVVLGKDGWLYLASERSVDDWRNIDPFSLEQLEQWRQMLEERHTACAKRGIPYLVIIAPSKYDIYPEYMPDALTRVRPECRFDQLLAYLREMHSPVHVLDLRPPLLDAKKAGVRLFQKTDTHWNDRGAWVAYQTVMAAVKRQVPTASILNLSDFEPVATVRPGMDLAGLLGLNDEITEQSLDLRPRISLRLRYVEQNQIAPITVQPSGPREPSVVVFRDSFFTVVLPFLAESFGRGVYLWEDGFDPKVIDAEKPAIVIQQIAQRKLMRPVPEMEKVLPVKLINGEWELAQPVH